MKKYIEKYNKNNLLIRKIMKQNTKNFEPAPVAEDKNTRMG